MIETRKISLSVEYKKTAYSAAVKADAEAGEESSAAGQAGGAAAGAETGGAAEGAASSGATAGATITLNAVPLYVSSTATSKAATKTGTYYLYDGILIKGRYRITNTPSRVGKTPVGQNVTGWVDAEAIGLSGGGGQGQEKQSEENAQGTGSEGTGSVSAAADAIPGEEIASLVESLTYTDNAADNSDSIDITLNAQDSEWLQGRMPEKGATLRARIRGFNWEQPGDSRCIECGLFVLDDVSFSDAPTTLQMGGVSKPSDSNFSELEREVIWKNTSIKRIGETIAARYGLGFSYDADDYDIECDEQDGTDSSYYNTLCKNYGLILKVYARRLWVYDREKYKEKPAVKTFRREDIRPGSFGYSTTLSGTYTGGYFNYTDADKDIDIVCSVGGGTHTKSVNRRATSVYDASVQLCAELNAANHGTVKLRFGVDGEWMVSAGNCIEISGYGNLDGKYFVDKVTHKVSDSGITSDFECSGVGTAFRYWEVGGQIEYHEQEEDSGENYSSTYETTSPAANAASSAAGAVAGAAVTLTNAPFYVASTSESPACYKSGTYYFYDGILIRGRYRMTNTAARCGKLPVGQNVTGWVPASYCGMGG
ncbi:Phage protein D [uncultured Flavonifractor sp.]|nr:Phage protein D [uncultured Flavonifractor sp.]